MSYNNSLPDAFPYWVEVPDKTAEHWVKFLLDYDITITPNGSSFAVTSDTSHWGTFRFWLSRISFQRLQNAGLIETNLDVRRKGMR